MCTHLLTDYSIAYILDVQKVFSKMKLGVTVLLLSDNLSCNMHI